MIDEEQKKNIELNLTSNQVKNVPNPTGKGGFGERPEDINTGGSWTPENSQNYCLRFFLRMNEDQFKLWGQNNPPETRTVAQVLAYERVTVARKELPDYREVVDRTEGKAPQTFKHEGQIDTGHNEIAELLLKMNERLFESETDSKGNS